jgi:hypothetical protein
LRKQFSPAKYSAAIICVTLEIHKKRMPMTELTADRFEALVGEHFTVVKNDGEEQWRVTEVKRRSQHALRKDQPFNLYLVAPAHDGNRMQGIRHGRFSDGESFEFFAVPIAAKGEEITFEVIFN